MYLKSNMTVGGSVGMIGNEEQVRYALFKLFSDDFTFFHQHITEDIELHNGDDVTLVQVKRNQNTPGAVAIAIRKYLEKPDFVEFILRNKANIISWEWVSNVTKKIDFKDVAKLINVEDITKNTANEGETPHWVVILSKKKVKEFLELLQSVFIFVKAPWISSSDYSKKIFDAIKIASTSDVKYAWKDRARDYLMNQIKIFLDKSNVNLDTFLELRSEFIDYSKKRILHDVMDEKAFPLSNDATYKKLYEMFGTFEANVIVSSNSEPYIRSKIENTGINVSDVMKLKEEIGGSDEN